LFYSPGSATSGGGHNYFDEIFCSFLACACETSHQFVVLVFEERPAIDLPPNVQWVSLHPNVPRRIFRSGVYEVNNLYRRCILGSNAEERPYQRYLREKACEYKIQMTLSWVPGADLYYLPFITTVWDLGHRVHPYFLELAANGEWERREEMCRRL